MLMDLIVCAMVALIFDRPVFLEMEFSKDIYVHSLYTCCILYRSYLDFLLNIEDSFTNLSRFWIFNLYLYICIMTLYTKNNQLIMGHYVNDCCFLVYVET